MKINYYHWESCYNDNETPGILFRLAFLRIFVRIVIDCDSATPRRNQSQSLQKYAEKLVETKCLGASLSYSAHSLGIKKLYSQLR